MAPRSRLIFGLLLLPPAALGADEGADPKAQARAREFLKPAQRGREVLTYVHFGSKYERHTYTERRSVADDRGRRVRGHFALVYRFTWENDGDTEIAFLCDVRGTVYQVQVVKTNAVANQPFLTANGTARLLGNLLLESFGDQMASTDRRELEKLVASADARGMLVWSLRFQQARLSTTGAADPARPVGAVREAGKE